MNAILRQRLDDVEPMLTGADIVARYGRAPASLVADGAVLVWVTEDGQRLYPEVQFGPDGPVPVIADVVQYLGAADWSAERLAAWFYEPRPTLRDQAPIEILHENPDAVRALALGEAGPDNRRVMSG